MKKRRINLKLTAALFLTAILIAGCATSPHWREEAKLPDGGTALVNRYLVYGNVLDQEFSESSQGRPVKGSGLRVELPSGGWSSWWEELGLYPLAVGRGDEGFYLATMPSLCGDYDKWGRPVPPYVFFRYEGREWKRVTLEFVPENMVNTNLAYVGRSSLPYVLTKDVVRPSDLGRLNKGLSDEVLHIYRSGVKGFEGCRRRLEAVEKYNEKRK